MEQTAKRKFTGKAIIAIVVVAILLIAVMKNFQTNEQAAELNSQFTEAELAHQVAKLNGEIVVNNVIINAPRPYYATENDADFLEGVNLLALTMVPLQPIAEELDYAIILICGTPIRSEKPVRALLNVTVGNASFDIGSTEVRIDENPAFELLIAPYVDDNGMIFVPLTFFRDALGKTVYIFEGQVVIASYSDMH